MNPRTATCPRGLLQRLVRPLKPLRGSLIARSGTGPAFLFCPGRPVADLDPPLVDGPPGPLAGSSEAGRLAAFVVVDCAPAHPVRTIARPHPTTRLRRPPPVALQPPVLWRPP